ncbi:uncharacterized protein LOC120624858 [Pararge aegeria]|uniref:uncharacterized protein LOC120624858 n=1 Tax=Pararge aegeria TaxID=116150 RepID=UPI0019D3137E|nr:uncharacterized protein LOC120624858 [Pararge aegeria]
MQGDGVWSVINVDSCGDKLENVVVGIKVDKHRVNRTHEVFRAEVDAAMIIDDSFGIFIDVCKIVDGGCKHYTNIVDGLKKLLYTHAKKNAQIAFELAGIDPPDFPLPEGHHLLDNFLLDYCELPTYCAYGTYEAEAFVIKDKEQVGCLKVVAEFAQPEEETC